MLVPEAVVGLRVGPVLVVLLPGTEVVDDFPVVDVPWPEVPEVDPGTALLVAVVMDCIPLVTEMRVVGLLVVLVPRKHNMLYL